MWRLLLVIGAYLFGFLTSLIPSPDDASVFWVSNVGAPYALLPLVTGALSRRLLPAALSGAAVAVAAIAGFYRLHAVGFGRSPSEFDLPADTDPTALRIEAYRVWLDALAFGNRPWLVIAAVVGLAVGCLGWAWWRRGHVLGAVAVAGILVLEPLVHASGAVSLLPPYSRSAGNLSIWLVEAAAGVGLIWWMLRRRSGSSRLEGSTQDGHDRSVADADRVLPRT